MFVFTVYACRVTVLCIFWSSLAILNRQSQFSPKQNGLHWPILCWLQSVSQSISQSVKCCDMLCILFKEILKARHQPAISCKYWTSGVSELYIYVYLSNHLSLITSRILRIHRLITRFCISLCSYAKLWRKNRSSCDRFGNLHSSIYYFCKLTTPILSS